MNCTRCDREIVPCEHPDECDIGYVHAHGRRSHLCEDANGKRTGHVATAPGDLTAVTR